MSSITPTISTTTRQCAQCNSPATLRCSARSAADPSCYCTKPCQKTNWSSGTHKLTCKIKRPYAACLELSLPHDRATRSSASASPSAYPKTRPSNTTSKTSRPLLGHRPLPPGSLCAWYNDEVSAIICDTAETTTPGSTTSA
jgi:hypothetical protein